MKRVLSVSLVALPLLLVYIQADAKTGRQQGYEPATVVSVDKHETPSNNAGGTPTDAPLQTDDYSYDVGIRLNCNIYVGRYESATDYLPSVFAPNHTVDVRLDKHLMYVSLPDGDRILKMGIVSHKRVKEESCPANG
jgi:hypothetical protein